ncbi:MAG: NYN domain-containing protein [Acidobacteriaceae bacterium]
MLKPVAVLIDGGHLRVMAKKSGKNYVPAFIEQFSKKCVIHTDEELQRVLYYDCPPYNGTAKLPVSGTSHTFISSTAWLGELACRELFAVRQGVLKFRGFVPNKTPVPGNKVLTDADFKPLFEQKGVDMRIGLDIANYAQNRSVSRILLVSNDTDCIPALKLARISGLQTVLVCLPGRKSHSELAAHADYVRKVSWP